LQVLLSLSEQIKGVSIKSAAKRFPSKEPGAGSLQNGLVILKNIFL
jgi:hypothetical protein